MNDEEGYSLVNDFRGDCLSVFDSQGNKIHKVAYLKYPRGIILDPKSGSLYVATNGTILTFSV